MKRRIFFFCFLVLGALLTLYPGVDIKQEKFRQELQTQLNRLVKETAFPGATLAVVLPNGQYIHIAAGFSDLESRDEMKPGSRIFSGSIGKTFVAAVVLQLMEEKKLSLEDKVQKYFTHCPWYGRVPNGSKLTVRMLLNHTGGLPEHILDDAFRTIIIKNPDRIYKPAELIAYILDKKPVHEAGNGWSYSDTDYIFLGMIIEKITGRTYYEELTRRILKPLQLDQTTPADRQDLAGLAAGYTGKEPFGFPGKVLVNGKYVVNPQFEWTGGGLVTTSLDLAVWAKRLYEGKAITPASVQKMLEIVDTKDDPNTLGYGLGVQVWKSDNGPIYGHSGIFPGYQSIMEYLPNYKFSIALQINIDRTVLEQAKNLHKRLSVFIPIIIGYLTEK
ncbi:MAG TPA: serine hydrolase domain-containing protein [Candidatus Deferrimicrobium sp.]|nr:serine hydrolase domain-containing protein [Candidatus Deferrimicrobium sp.]